MSRRYPGIKFQRPTQRDLENLAALRRGSQRASPAHSEEDPPNSGLTPEDSGALDPEEELTPERKIRRNERGREARLRAMQDRLEVINELREAGCVILKND